MLQKNGLIKDLISNNGRIIRLWKNGDVIYQAELPIKTLTYDANGGSNAPAPQEFTTNTTITNEIPTLPEDAAEHLGWSESMEALTPDYAAGDIIYNEMLLYAVYKYNGIRCHAGASSNGNVVTFDGAFEDLINILPINTVCNIKYYSISIGRSSLETINCTVSNLDVENNIITLTNNNASETITFSMNSATSISMTCSNHNFARKHSYDLLILPQSN